jgi:hypothetical protein
MECTSLNNWELVLPPNGLYLDCREALFNSPEFSSRIHSFHGHIYINMKESTITGVVKPRRLENGKG